MTPKNRTLEGKNQTLGGEGGSKIVENRRTSFMYVPLDICFQPDIGPERNFAIYLFGLALIMRGNENEI